MRIWLALVLLAALSGCVTTPVFKPALTQVKGEVRLAGRLPFPARVEVTVLSVIDGRPLAVAATEYDVTMLPLVFELRLTPLQMAEGDLYLRTRLRFIGSSAVQASHQQKVFKAFNPDGYVISLQPKTCYPLCQ
ncbi:YscW family type III secretion system pilotin [Aeromonas hydrophila]|uniref:YscW family type III secretion system pilotin n=1 Tax=Aeromonas hydrophila TaxID=644 RepID=UPI0002DF0FE5|nr:YscW family type III secretion system pilotin [Aeromonas hydrophila]